MKEQMKHGNTHAVKGIMKIRLHMWNVKKNHPKNDPDTICPIYGKEKRYNRASVKRVKGKRTIRSNNIKH